MDKPDFDFLFKQAAWCLCLSLLAVANVYGGLSRVEVEAVYGPPKEIIHEVPGRPWVEQQTRYQRKDALVSFNYVGDKCLWIDFWSRGTKLEQSFVFQELKLLIPEATWAPQTKNGRIRSWMSENEDRLTKRATGFTLHMNDYIRNVLSRREKWRF